MLKKTIEYKDYNDDEVSEDLYFHLTEADVVELELSHQGGLEEWIRRVIKAEDGKQIFQEFKKIILMSYGKRSEDGKRFVKNAQIREEFESSEAFSTLVMELLTDTDKAAEFVRGIVPTSVSAEAAKLDLETPKEAPKEIRKVTRQELVDLSAEDFKEYQAQMLRGEVELVD